MHQYAEYLPTKNVITLESKIVFQGSVDTMLYPDWYYATL